jgi:predicted amidohydrolase
MASWTIAAVQMDCRLNEFDANLDTVCQRLNTAADQGAKLVVFPECALTGYGFASRAEAMKVGDTLPGKASERIAFECKKRDVFAVVGMLERDGDKLYNAAALVGPKGFITSYRKVHLPCIGLDRFVDPGDRPYAVHDLGGLRLGLGICFDLSFPEASRLLTLAGADLIALPTNWAPPSQKMADLVCRVRALENHVYFGCVNRVGDESGFHYIGHSGIVDCRGDFLARADHDREAIITATIDPEVARQKKTVVCAGEYEIDRINWRRPEMYGPLTERR